MLFRKLDPVVDLWMPFQPRLASGRPGADEELSFYQQKGKPFATYGNSNCLTNPLMGYYRLRGMGNWLIKSGGMAICALNFWLGNDWCEFDHAEQDGFFFYHGDNGPIPSIRVEAFREGLEDYYLLYLAKKKLANGTNAKLAALASDINLEQLMQEENPDNLLQWRESMLTELASGVE